MRKVMLLVMLALGMLIPITGSLSAGNPKSPEGIWTGALDIMGNRLRIVFKVTKNPDGGWKTALDSPDQGARDIPVSETVVRGDSLILQVAVVRGKFEGLLNAAGDSLTGKWTQGGISMPLNLSKAESLPVTTRSQEPAPPYPYVSEDVQFHNAAAGIDLAGTFTRPSGKGVFPAVALLTGSGAQDRDETVFGHKPFLVLADHLTRSGIAVLRFDDRGTGKSGGNIRNATTLDFVTDALAAVDYLKSRSDVKPERIGLAGHSEGAIIAPLAASRNGDISFLVLLAGPGLRGDSLLFLQGEAIMKASGTDARSISKNREIQKRLFAVVETEPDTAAAAQKIRGLLEDALKELTEEEKQQTGFSAETIPLQVRQINSPWIRFFLTYDPVKVLEKIRIPVLALWGEKDLQVPPAQNLPLMQAAFAKAGNKKADLRVLPSMNHLFQTCSTGAPSEYAAIDETFSPDALNAVSGWILRLP
ncbi:alpha/beta fold hydrolase [bacterium]|nr:alpha/beta fold hydrolase [bacterium]